jgi:hypothetical protein
MELINSGQRTIADAVNDARRHSKDSYLHAYHHADGVRTAAAGSVTADLVGDVAWRPISKESYSQPCMYTMAELRASMEAVNALGGPKIEKCGALDGSQGAFRSWTQTQTQARFMDMDEARVHNTPRRLQLLLPECD